MIVKKGALVVVADASGATVYKVANRVNGVKLDDLECIENERVPRTSDLGSGRPPRVVHSATRRGALEVRDLHDEAEREFAQHLTERLDDLSGDARRGLILFAPPRFLGMMRPHMSDRVRSALVAEVPKDLMKIDLPSLETAVGALEV